MTKTYSNITAIDDGATDAIHRQQQFQSLIAEVGADGCLVASQTGMLYIAGCIFRGYIYLPAAGEALFFCQREPAPASKNLIFIRKPEDIPDLLRKAGHTVPRRLLLEAGQISHSEFQRLEKAFRPEETADATILLRRARMIKTEWEIGQFRISARCHEAAYSRIPEVFRSGMTDIAFQIEIERLMRQHGSLGIFRAFGNMDIFMGSLLTGNNAAAPSPYDFALGGAGLHPCLPIGASGEAITEGKTAMVDSAGNFTAYMTDMTRVYACGRPSQETLRAHELSCEMHRRLEAEVRPGVSCASVWEWSLKMAQDAGLAANFMGFGRQAAFVGHGVGIEINEPPVLSARSTDHFAEGMVFAYEPKFVLPGVGAVGNENTFIVTRNGIERITLASEEIYELK